MKRTLIITALVLSIGLTTTHAGFFEFFSESKKQELTLEQKITNAEDATETALLAFQKALINESELKKESANREGSDAVANGFDMEELQRLKNITIDRTKDIERLNSYGGRDLVDLILHAMFTKDKTAGL